MSAWRIALRALHQAGGTAEAATFGTDAARRALARLGLATHNPVQYGPVPVIWTITQRGIDVIENRVKPVRLRTGPCRWVATWLKALPRNMNEGL